MFLQNPSALHFQKEGYHPPLPNLEVLYWHDALLCPMLYPRILIRARRRRYRDICHLSRALSEAPQPLPEVADSNICSQAIHPEGI
jgi:hypothetical protein